MGQAHGDVSRRGDGRIVACTELASEGGGKVEMLEETVNVDINNIDRWLRRYLEKGKEAPYPICLSLPFNTGIFAYRDSHWFSDVKKTVGVECVATMPGGMRGQGDPLVFSFPDGSTEDVSAMVHVNVFVDRGYLGRMKIAIDFSGVPVKGSDSYEVVDTISSSPLLDVAEKELMESALMVMAHTALHAINFMHCKNIELIDMPISRQQRRLAERKNKPLIQYKTLVIEPFKKQVRNEARQTGQSEIQRALHIARGHFRTYTEEKPLFGKLSGTFWIPMHLRGNKAKGVVHKDYEVKAGDGD